MTTPPDSPPAGAAPATVEMPAPTSSPLLLAAGLGLLGLGLATSYAIAVVGLLLFAFALTRWVGQMLPGKGHVAEPLVDPALRAKPPASRYRVVELLESGRPGYRFRMPEKVHPLSSGIKGGILGGLVMPVPTAIYGVVSGHGIWFPINLLAAVLLPSMQDMTVEQLQAFQPGAFAAAVGIHVVLSVGFGLLYGVVLPMLPTIPAGPIVWGGLLMPVFWTWLCYSLMGLTNPVLERYIEWRWFLLSQFVYGVVMSAVVYRSEKVFAEPVHGGGPGRTIDQLTGEGGAAS